VLFFVDDTVAHPAYDSGGRGTTRARHGWRGAHYEFLGDPDKVVDAPP